MNGEKERSSGGKFLSYILLALIIIFLIPDPGLCKKNNPNEPNFDINWIAHTPGKFYTIQIEYIAAYGDEDNSEALGLDENDVRVQLLPVAKEQFEDTYPNNWEELGSKFKPEFSWTVELKPKANDPKLVLKWEMVSKKFSGKAKKPFGQIEILVPN
jgi:hypothetical protein